MFVISINFLYQSFATLLSFFLLFFSVLDKQNQHFTTHKFLLKITCFIIVHVPNNKQVTTFIIYLMDKLIWVLLGANLT